MLFLTSPKLLLVIYIPVLPTRNESGFITITFPVCIASSSVCHRKALLRAAQKCPCIPRSQATPQTARLQETQHSCPSLAARLIHESFERQRGVLHCSCMPQEAHICQLRTLRCTDMQTHIHIHTHRNRYLHIRSYILHIPYMS